MAAPSSIALTSMLALSGVTSAEELAPPPALERDLVICPHETVGELLARWAAEVGIVLSIGPETARLLEEEPTGVLDDLRVPRQWGSAVLGVLLREHDIVLHPVTARVGPVFGVTSLNTRARNAPRRGCVVTRDEVASGRVMASLEVELRVRIEHLDPLLVQRDLPRVLHDDPYARVLAAGHEAWIRATAAETTRLLLVLEAAERAAGGAGQDEAWPGTEPWPGELPSCDLEWHPLECSPDRLRRPRVLELVEAWSRATGHALLVLPGPDGKLRQALFPRPDLVVPAAEAARELDARMVEVGVSAEVIFAVTDPAAPRVVAIRDEWSLGGFRRAPGVALSLTAVDELARQPMGERREVMTGYASVNRSAYTLAESLEALPRGELGVEWQDKVRVTPLGPRLVVLAGYAPAVAERVARLRELDHSPEGGDDER